ncbi:MAG: type II secretion system protein N, partial [Mariprofundus sp.]
ALRAAAFNLRIVHRIVHACTSRRLMQFIEDEALAERLNTCFNPTIFFIREVRISWSISDVTIKCISQASTLRLVEVGLLIVLACLVSTIFLPQPDSGQAPDSWVKSGKETLSPIKPQAFSIAPLFGKAEVPAAVKKPASAPQPEDIPRLKIRLSGTVIAGDRSSAIMTVGTSAETTFFLGDVLYGRVFLKKVEADAVILSDRGHDEWFGLMAEKRGAGRTPRKTPR